MFLKNLKGTQSTASSSPAWARSTTSKNVGPRNFHSTTRCVYICVLQCVAVCCCVWQCVAVCCSVLQCVAVCCGVLQLARWTTSKFVESWIFHSATTCVYMCVLQCVAVFGSVLQCDSLLQCVAVSCRVLQWNAMCCDVLQCVSELGVHCSVSPCVAVCCGELQRATV